MPNVILATASYDRTIKFWEAPSGICVRTLQFQDSQVNCMAISPHKTGLVAAGHHHIRMFDLQSNCQIPAWSVEAHQQNITSIGFQKDGKWIYSGSEDNWIKIWDVRTQTVKRKYDCKASVNALALHCNQGELISGDQNGVIRLWDLKADSCFQSVAPRPDTSIRSITINSGGDMACVANNHGDVFCLEIGDTPTGPSSSSRTNAEAHQDRLKLVHTFRAHNRYILKCLFSPNQRVLATTSADWTVNLWNTAKCGKPDVEPWSLWKTLRGHNRWVWDCAFSADSAYMVTASSDHTAKLWDVNKGASIVNYSSHLKPVICIVLDDASPDKKVP
jgi:G protein beta subunit-like protein